MNSNHIFAISGSLLGKGTYRTNCGLMIENKFSPNRFRFSGSELCKLVVTRIFSCVDQFAFLYKREPSPNSTFLPRVYLFFCQEILPKSQSLCLWLAQIPVYLFTVECEHSFSSNSGYLQPKSTIIEERCDAISCQMSSDNTRPVSIKNLPWVENVLRIKGTFDLFHDLDFYFLT